MATVKKVKLNVPSFQSSWTYDFGFIQQNDRAVYALRCENVVCRTSSVKRHFETKHDKTFKDSADKAEAIKKAVSRSEKQSNAFKNLSASKNNATEAIYKLALCIAKYGKPFTDSDFIKAAFLVCSEVLCDGISNKHMIILRLIDMPVSARSAERRISEMADNVSEQQTAAQLHLCSVSPWMKVWITMTFPAWLFLPGIVMQRYMRSCAVLNLCMELPSEKTY